MGRLLAGEPARQAAGRSMDGAIRWQWYAPAAAAAAAAAAAGRSLSSGEAVYLESHTAAHTSASSTRTLACNANQCTASAIALAEAHTYQRTHARPERASECFLPEPVQRIH